MEQQLSDLYRFYRQCFTANLARDTSKVFKHRSTIINERLFADPVWTKHVGTLAGESFHGRMVPEAKPVD